MRECLRSGFVSAVGPMVGRFERAFAQQVGARHAVAVSSGTAALHAALLAAGIGPGDRVVVPDLTFVASANPVLQCGAEPLFADVDPDTWMLDPRLLAALCRRFQRSSRPLRAVVPVHLYGGACDMPAIMRVARRFGLKVIEDATEALGATARGRQVGTFGDLGCFSFNGNKMITTGNGGMIVTGSARLADTARHLAAQARADPLEYLHDRPGFNYRMSSLAAALGLGQLERLDLILTRKRRIGMRYAAVFAGAADFRLQRLAPGMRHCFWLNSIVLHRPDQRDRWLKHLNRLGIGARPFFRPLHTQPYMKGPLWVLRGNTARPARSGHSDRIAAGGINIPSSAGLDPTHQARVIAAILELARR